MAFRHEAFSFFSHLAGALAALAGLVLLVVRAEGVVAKTAFSVYGGTLIAMFASSTLHHVAHREDGFFRRLDMSVIYLFIAGTYTPVCLLVVPPAWGVPFLALVWVLAGVGVVLRWVVPRTPRWVTAGLYLGLGWISVLALPVLFRIMDTQGLVLLLAGGLVYTAGAVVYATRTPDPWPRHVGYHGLWHVFVLVAAALHFGVMWSILPTG